MVSGFVAVTDKWARLFFVINHAFSVMIAAKYFNFQFIEADSYLNLASYLLV